MESPKDFNRMEDSLLIVSDRGSEYRDLIIATKNRAGKYAMIYLPRPTPIQVNLDRLHKGKKRITWFNPVTGKKSILKEKYNTGIVSITPPSVLSSEIGIRWLPRPAQVTGCRATLPHLAALPAIFFGMR